MSILKRQRELKKSEKAAKKRSRRHGIREPLFQEPTPTIVSGGLFGSAEPEDDDDTQETPEADHETTQES